MSASPSPTSRSEHNAASLQPAQSVPEGDNIVCSRVRRNLLSTRSLRQWGIPYRCESTDHHYVVIEREMTEAELEPLFEHTRLWRKTKEKGPDSEESEEERELLSKHSDKDLSRFQKLTCKIEKNIPDIRGPNNERIGIINCLARRVLVEKELAEAYVREK